MSTRMQSCWRGVLRGARFGAIAGIVIWLVLLVLMWGAVLVFPSLREHAMADTQKDWERWGVLWVFGSLAATFGLMAMYGAIGGMVVMGIAGFFHPAKDQSVFNKANSTQESI